MDLSSIETLVSAGVGVGGGSVTVGWIAKLLIQRLIKENDQRHIRASEAINKMVKDYQRQNSDVISKLGKMTTDIEVIKARIGEVMNIRGDVIDNTKALTLVKERVENAKIDINQGLAGTRQRFSKVEDDISDIQRALLLKGAK